jgi:hypothetical protein
MPLRRVDCLLPEVVPEEEPAIPGKVRLQPAFLVETAVSPHDCLLPKTRAFLGEAQARQVSVSRTETANRP